MGVANNLHLNSYFYFDFKSWAIKRFECNFNCAEDE